MLLKFVLGLGSKVRAPSLVESSYNCVLNVVVTSTTDDMRPSPCWLICLHACLFAALKGLPHGREVVAEAATFNVSWRHAKFAVREPPSSLFSFFPLKGCLQNGLCFYSCHAYRVTSPPREIWRAKLRWLPCPSPAHTHRSGIRVGENGDGQIVDCGFWMSQLFSGLTEILTALPSLFWY